MYSLPPELSQVFYQSFFRKDNQNTTEPLAEGTFKYVSKETIQKFVFIVYSTARKLYMIFIDLILTKDIINTTIVIY